MEQARELPSGVVTFLLTDIEDSTRLWEEHQADMAPALERHDAVIDEVVSAHDGTVLKAKGEGDATLSVFRRASDAARAAHALNGRLESEPWPGSLEVRVRIALHTGEAHERSGDYFGPTLNRAARIRSVARGGQVVLSDVTCNLVRDRLPEDTGLIDLGEHDLRGLARAERIWALTLLDDPQPVVDETVRSAAEASSTRPLLPSALVPASANFVGRERERDQLAAAWEGASSTCTPRLVLLSGEPGVGKTRLASDVAKLAHDRGALVLFGRSDEDLGLPYQPWIEALRSLVATCSPDLLTAHVDRHAGEIGRLVPELTARLPTAPSPTSADPEAMRPRLFEAVTGLLAEASKESPILIVCDDLHWADRPTLLLLRHLVRAEAPLRMLVVGTYRDTDLDRAHPLADMAADLRREATVVRLSIGGLTEDDVAAYLAGAAGHELPAEGHELAGALYRETDGNPFFVGEVVRHLVERGLLYESDGRWTSDVSINDLGLPEGVREVISRRLSRLSDAANRAARVAALLGHSFTLRVLEAIPDSADDPDGLIDALEELVGAGLLEEAAGGFVFSHALVRQTLASELSGARRTRLHRRIGEALESLPDADRHVEALAFHFDHAALDGQMEKATRYALAAGRRADGRGAYDEARSHIERGLELLDLDLDAGSAPDLDTVARRAELMAELYQVVMNDPQADRDALRLLARRMVVVARDSGRIDLFARAAAASGDYGILGEGNTDVLQVCEEALARLGPDGDAALRALVMATLANCRAWHGGEGLAVAGLAADAVQLARASGDEDVLARALATTEVVLSGSPDLARQTEVNDEAVLLAQRRRDPWLLQGALFRRGEIALQRGDRDAYEDATARALHCPVRLYIVGFMENALRILDGELDAALETATAFSMGAAQVSAEAQALTVARELGRLEEFYPLLRDVAAQNVGITAVTTALALWESEMGRLDEARGHLKEVMAGFDAMSRDATYLVALALLSETAVACGEGETAALLREELRAWGGQIAASPAQTTYGAVDRYLAMTASMLGEHEEAEGLFAAALAREEQLGAPVLQARTLLWWGRARIAAGNAAGAGDLLERAREIADRLGMKLVQADAAALLAGA